MPLNKKTKPNQINFKTLKIVFYIKVIAIFWFAYQLDSKDFLLVEHFKIFFYFIFIHIELSSKHLLLHTHLFW